MTRRRAKPERLQYCMVGVVRRRSKSCTLPTFPYRRSELSVFQRPLVFTAA